MFIGSTTLSHSYQTCHLCITGVVENKKKSYFFVNSALISYGVKWPLMWCLVACLHRIMFTVFAGEMYILVTQSFNSRAADSNNDLSTMSISVKMEIDLASEGV